MNLKQANKKIKIRVEISKTDNRETNEIITLKCFCCCFRKINKTGPDGFIDKVYEIFIE